MDCISSSDRKAIIGLDILKSPKEEGVAADPSASPGQAGGPGKGRAGGRGKNTKGLDIGRRAIVFVKPSAPGNPCFAPNPDHGQQVVHVIDHGETQKEAIRRIFDMQITLQSCETQLVEREQEIQTLYDHVRMFLKDNDRSRLEDLVAGNLGPLVNEEELKQGPSNVEKRWVKEQAEKDPDGESHIIPPWMMNDELSRRIVEELRRRVTRLATDGLLTNQAAIEHLWQCGYRFVMRWNGGPTEILQRQNADLQKRLHLLQKETLLEASMLHQHIRRLENQFKGQQALKEKSRMLSTGMSLAPSESGAFHDRSAHADLYKKELQDDDTIQYSVRSAELEEMDHEIFEPILTFEEGQRDILIDMVNEKVRRILTLDPSKWNNERLPFGLRPDHLPANVQRLEEEIMMLKYELEKSEQDRSRLQALFASQLSGPNAETNGMWHKALAAMGLGGILGERSTEEVGVQVSPKDFLRRRRDKGQGEDSDGELDEEGRRRKKGGAEGDEERKSALAAEVAVATKPLQDRIAELEKLLETQGGGRGGKGASKWGLLPLRLKGAPPQSALEVANEALDRQSGMLYNVLKTVSKLVGSGATHKAQKAIQQLEKQFEATMTKKPPSRQSEPPSSPPPSTPQAEMGATTGSFSSTGSRAPSRRAHQREEPTHLHPEDASAPRKASKADPEAETKPRDAGTNAPPASEPQPAGGDRFLEAVLRMRRPEATLEPLEPAVPPPDVPPPAVPPLATQAKTAEKDVGISQKQQEPAPCVPKPPEAQQTPSAEQPKRAEPAREQANPQQEQHENVPVVKPVEVAKASPARVQATEVGPKDTPHASPSKRDSGTATQTQPAKAVAVKVEVPEPDVEEEPEATVANPSPKPVEKKVQLPPVVSPAPKIPGIPPAVAKEEKHLYDQNVPIPQDEEDEEGFEVPDDFQDNLDREKTLHDWAAETLNSLNGILDGSEEAPEDSEIGRLKKTIQEQEGEISRLLLIVDELRSRLGIAKDAAFEIGGDVGGALNSVMEKAGLKDMMDAGNPLKLKGVFQRLYTDACQRVQRYCLIRAQMLAASKANDSYTKQPIGVNMSMPELEKLRQTATSALRGMWYHTDYLFQRTCAYALNQGLEQSWFRPKEASVADFMPLSVGNGDDTIIVENTYDRKRPHRLRGRRGHRPRDPGDPHGFLPDDLGPGGTTLTPRQHRKAVLHDPEPTAFTTYVAGMREARGNLKSEEWSRCAKVVAAGKPLQGSYVDSFSRKSVKAATATMSTSQSLPALPKGRGPL